MAEQLRQELESVAPETFALAVERECRRRVDAFLTGVEAYRRHPYRRPPLAAPVVWSEGSTRLVDYSRPGATGVPVLVVPSLVNRSYIVDLSPRRSLMGYLAAKGLRPYLLDWDAPGAAEAEFSLDDYVAGRLSRALDVVTTRAGRPVVVGYCMGGLLALALGVLRQDDVLGLAGLAVPWDFHQPTPAQGLMVEHLRQPLEDAINFFGQLPVDLLQTFFTLNDTGGVERKFRAFAEMAPKSVRAKDFVALEDWLNDGVALTAKVARQCLFDWYADNATAKGTWNVAGCAVRPEAFIKPALALIPAKDRIVPPASAAALADALPNVKKRIVPAGHIGMVAGARAVADTYIYLTKWLNKVAGS